MTVRAWGERTSGPAMSKSHVGRLFAILERQNYSLTGK